jgi:hypothetical protein
MWSDRYYYLNIFHDAELSVYCKTRELTDFLKTIPELKQKGEFTFSNSSLFPVFLNLILLYTPSLNSWSKNDTDHQKTNLIAIVCAKNNLRNFEQLKELLIKIASFVKWQLVDEHTDNGIENYIIWATDEKI